MVSIKKNFLYNSFLTTANYLFTFLTYPYVSRVLGVERIGTVNFVDSAINYFIMLSMLGVSIVGIREIAKAKGDRNELNRTFSSILSINIVLTAAALIVLGIVCLFIPKLQEHPQLMMLGVAKIIANAFILDWFFTGTENFRVITLRTLFVRTLYVICTFCLVRSPDDFSTYYALLSMTVVANAIVNAFYLRRFVSFTLCGLQPKPFVVPILILGLYMFFGNFYSTFNTMFLGLKWGDTEVGYFTTATKLFTIIIALFTAFTGVMMPRMSSLLKENNLNEYHQLFRKSVSILIIFCLPLVLLTIFQADNIILIISGKGYEGAILPMQISMPLLMIIGYNQILIHQGLMPLAKDKAVLLSSMGGGMTALTLCFLLIPTFGSVGSALLWVASEVVVNAVSGFFIFRYIGIAFPLKRLLSALLWHTPLFLLLLLMRGISDVALFNLIASSTATFLYCFLLQCFIIKDEIVLRLFHLK